MEKREKYVEELFSFTTNIKNEITNILSDLGWTLPNVSKNIENMVVCPFDTSHRLPMCSLEKHLEACQWKAEDYKEFDVSFSEPTFQQHTSSSIMIDEELQKQILQNAKKQDQSLKIGVGEQLIPRTSNRLFSDFTTDERKVLYDYVVSQTVKPDIGRDITDLSKVKSHEEESNKISMLELLAHERNMKRRRTKHRGVHTNKKSHTEIMREVISQQMEMYAEYIAEQEYPDSSQEVSKNITEEHNPDCNYKMYTNATIEPSHQKSNYIADHERSKNYEKFEGSNFSQSRHRLRHNRSKSRDRKSHKKERHHSKERHHEKRKSHRSRDRESSHRNKKSKHDRDKKRSRSKDF